MNLEREKIDAESQALVYSQQVFAGAKLAASLMVRKGLSRVVAAMAKREGCHTVIDGDGDWEIVLIYKYPFVPLLAKQMEARRSMSDPPSLLDVWSTGKLFGYSDYEIAKYLEDRGYIESALMSESESEPNEPPCSDNQPENRAELRCPCSG